MQTFIIDLDDWSALKPGMDQLKKMKEHYPNFKCTLFTTPFNPRFITKEVETDKLYEWGKLVADESDWLEIAPHGFAHLKGECMTKDRASSLRLIKATETIFNRIGVNFVKVFKAPHWLMSEEFEKVLKERDYVKAVDRNRPIVYTDIPTYVWNWSIDEPIPDYHTVKGHGHVYLTNNGIDRCLPNLLKIPTDSKFQFVSEYLKENGQRIFYA